MFYWLSGIWPTMEEVQETPLLISTKEFSRLCHEELLLHIRGMTWKSVYTVFIFMLLFYVEDLFGISIIDTI